MKGGYSLLFTNNSVIPKLTNLDFIKNNFSVQTNDVPMHLQTAGVKTHFSKVMVALNVVYMENWQ